MVSILGADGARSKTGNNLISLNRGYNYGMINVIERRPFSELGDRQLLERTKRLAANQRCLEVHILDHLDEIDRRGLALRRGFSSLFDYTIIGHICKSYNGLLVTPMIRYYFRNPLVLFQSHLIRFGLAPERARGPLSCMTVDGAGMRLRHRRAHVPHLLARDLGRSSRRRA